MFPSKKAILLILFNVFILSLSFHFYNPYQPDLSVHDLVSNASANVSASEEHLVLTNWTQPMQSNNSLSFGVSLSGLSSEKIIEAQKRRVQYKANLIDSIVQKRTENQTLLSILKESRSELFEANIFRLLGVYNSPQNSHFNDYPNAEPHYTIKYMSFSHDPTYCDVVDSYNLLNPSNVFRTKNFVGDYVPQSLVKSTIFPELGKDVMLGFHAGNNEGEYPINAAITTFFMKTVLLHHYYKIGTHFLCASQIYNHIPGSGVLTRKDLNVGLVNDYSKKYEDKPQCFNKEMYFPSAFRLSNKTECLEFFQKINSTEYQTLRKTEPVPFLIKIGWGVHRGEGLYLFDTDKEEEIRNKYNEGASCGKIGDDLIAQKYISNPLLLDKQNKFDFRIYMLIASVDPLIVYYHDGFLRVSLSRYDKSSKEEAVHFTNTHLSKKIFEDAQNGKEFYGMNEQELRDYQMWTMEELQEYLFEIGKIKNKQWLDEYLRPKFKEAFIHTVRMAKHSFMKNPGVFEIFGLDFLLDENLNLWFVECNPSPQFVGTNEYKTQFLTKMLKDMFEIEYAFLRSRWRRTVEFIKEFSSVLKSQTVFSGLSQWKKDYQNIIKNKLEPQYRISEDNSWSLIIDGNLSGKQAYLGFFPDECLDEDEF